MACFDRDLHVGYMVSMLEGLPSFYESHDSIRMTLAYFAISSLDLLQALHKVSAKRVIDWVYATQVLPITTAGDITYNGTFHGFRGSFEIGIQFNPDGAEPINYDGGHLACTYAALGILKILGDDCCRVHRTAILNSLQSLQQPDGSFIPIHTDAEADLRFVYCAVAVCSMLGDWTGIDIERTLQYILDCQSYDGGFGLSPGLESHGGATYCAIAALKLMGHIVPDPMLGFSLSTIVDVKTLIGWCLQRQTCSGGFQGRANKDSDSCYAFWVGSTLKMLGGDHLCDVDPLLSFQLTCQTKYGGFSKWPRELPDLLHSYFSICGFSLFGNLGLKPICCELGFGEKEFGGENLLEHDREAAQRGNINQEDLH